MSMGETIPSKTDVVIVGAGPAGLALAIQLQQAGVRHLLLDKLSEGLNTSRAGVLHAHTLESLQELGVSHALVGRGLKVARFAIRDRDRALVRLSFDTLPSQHPYLLMLPQDETEDILSQRLDTLGGMVHRGVTATGVTRNGAGGRVSLEWQGGSAAIDARYVVGADGLQSLVRSAAGIEFEGGTYHHSFVLADVRMDWAFGENEVSLFFSPEGLVVVAPLPKEIFRVVATVDQAPEHPTIEDVQALVDARGPVRGQTLVRELSWSSRFRIHHRLARSYRSGCFLLVGDAAHVHSPAGGQGMNTGLVDAVVLGRLLADVLTGRRDDRELDLYSEVRRPAARKVLGLVGFLTKLATIRGDGKRAIRNNLLALAGALPPVRSRLSMNLSGLSRRKDAVLPPASGSFEGLRN